VLTTLTEVADPGHTAIIVIDMQNEIVSDQGGYATRTETGQTFATGHQALIPKIQALLDAARRRGILVTKLLSPKYRRCSMPRAGGASWSPLPSTYIEIDSAET
jgi:hypothetical protein